MHVPVRLWTTRVQTHREKGKQRGLDRCWQTEVALLTHQSDHLTVKMLSFSQTVQNILKWQFIKIELRYTVAKNGMEADDVKRQDGQVIDN